MHLSREIIKEVVFWTCIVVGTIVMWRFGSQRWEERAVRTEVERSLRLQTNR